MNILLKTRGVKGEIAEIRGLALLAKFVWRREYRSIGKLLSGICRGIFVADVRDRSAKLPTNNLGSFDNDFYARGMHDSDLAVIIAALPHLSDAVRVGILATVNAIRQTQGT